MSTKTVAPNAQQPAFRSALEAAIAQHGLTLDAVWLLWDAYTDQLSHRLGDADRWLAWHCHDNAMGAKGLEVSSFSRSIKVRTLRQLATVIAINRTETRDA